MFVKIKETVIAILAIGFIAFLLTASLIQLGKYKERECVFKETEYITKYEVLGLRFKDEECIDYLRRMRETEHEFAIDKIEQFRMKEKLSE